MRNKKLEDMAVGCLMIGIGTLMLSVSVCILHLTSGG